MEIARKIIAGTFIALTFIPLALINMLHVPAGVAPDWMKGPVWLFMWWLMFMMALGLVAFVLESASVGVPVGVLSYTIQPSSRADRSELGVPEGEDNVAPLHHDLISRNFFRSLSKASPLAACRCVREGRRRR